MSHRQYTPSCWWHHPECLHDEAQVHLYILDPGGKFYPATCSCPSSLPQIIAPRVTALFRPTLVAFYSLLSFLFLLCILCGSTENWTDLLAPRNAASLGHPLDNALFLSLCTHGACGGRESSLFFLLFTLFPLNPVTTWKHSCHLILPPLSFRQIHVHPITFPEEFGSWLMIFFCTADPTNCLVI